MSKKGTKALASATLMSLVLTTALSAGPVQAAAGQVTRTSGVDRYATAASVATANWTTSESVVLVNGDNYPDAVSASALAKKLNAPILLTKAADLNADTKEAISKLGAKKIYVVGGEASVSTAVRNELKATTSLVELGGKNRYETNVAVANELVKLGVDASNVLLVGGEGFSDALSVAPVAAAKGQILLLGNNNEDSMESVIAFVKANSSKVTVVGTSNVISDAMYSALGAVERVNGGATRFETNMNVLNKFAADLKADKLFVANASGNGFADALVASALAGKTASPLVLVDAEGTSATTAAVDYIKAKATKTTDLNVIGGVGVVADSTVAAIDNAVNPPVAGLAIDSIDEINSTKLVIHFNTAVDNADDIESDGNRIVVYNAGQNLSSAVIKSSSISFSSDKKTATVILTGGTIATGTNYTVALVDKGANLDLANVVASSTGVLVKGFDTPTATVNNGQDNFVISYSQKMTNAALTQGNYTVYDEDNNAVAAPFSGVGTWDDSTAKKVVKLPLAAGKFDAGKTYKIVVNTASVKADDGTTLSDSQKVFTVSTPSVSDAKPVIKIAQVTAGNTLKVTFDKDIANAAVAKNLITVKKSSGTAIAVNAANVAGKDLTITTNNATDFEAGKTYTVSLGANIVYSNMFKNVATDAVDNYQVTSASNTAAKSVTAQFLRNSDDKTKSDLVVTFDQPVKAIPVAAGNELAINYYGTTYTIKAGANLELYTSDTTGKSLIVKDVEANFLSGGTGLATESSKTYQVVAYAGKITTNTPDVAPKKNTEDLKATTAGIDVQGVDIDKVTLVSDKEIDVKFKETVDTSELQASDITVQGFIKSVDGTVSNIKSLSGSNQVKYSVSGDTITITPANDSIEFATGKVGAADITIVSFAANTLKDSSGIENSAAVSMATNSSDLIDNAAPIMMAAANITDNDTLLVTYTENVQFKAGGTVAGEAAQFSVDGVKTNQYATNAVLANNTITLTLTGSFEAGKDYSQAKASYTRNANNLVKDLNDNEQVSGDLVGIASR